MVENIYWFMFILGLGSFAGFVLIARALITATPKSIEELSRQILSLEETLINHVDLISKSVEDEESNIAEILQSLNDLSVSLKKLIYQHEHADNFNFGTKDTNKKLDVISNEVLTLRVNIETFLRSNK